MERPLDNRITVNLFPVFGPQVPLKLCVSSYDTLGCVRWMLSRRFRISIHDEIVIIWKGKELNSEFDSETLDELGIEDGDSLTIGLYTPPLPLESRSIVKVKVEADGVALKKCIQHAEKHPDAEVAGVLVGKEVAGDQILVVDSIPIAEGSPTSVSLIPLKIASVADQLRGSENYIVGWYHSHMKSDVAMSGIDARLQSGYQQLYPNTIALILDPVSRVAEFYRVEGIRHPQVVGSQVLNLPKPRLLSMDSDTITLTTILEEREEAEIVAFSGSDATCGDYAKFSVTVKNVGTAPFSKARAVVHVTSPDGKESVHEYSDDISLSPGAFKSYAIRCQIPVSWPSGSALARAAVRNMVTRSWLCPWITTSISLLQSPIREVKLIVYRTSQKVGKGQVATYVVYIKNAGNRRDKIEINWDLSQVPELWATKMYDGEVEKTPPFNIELDAGATRKLVLEVTPPSEGCVGGEVPITVKAKSLSSGAGEAPLSKKASKRLDSL